jgi:hypothetical protein
MVGWFYHDLYPDKTVYFISEICQIEFSAYFPVQTVGYVLEVGSSGECCHAIGVDVSRLSD